jgi:hypothetical protein
MFLYSINRCGDIWIIIKFWESQGIRKKTEIESPNSSSASYIDRVSIRSSCSFNHSLPTKKLNRLFHIHMYLYVYIYTYICPSLGIYIIVSRTTNGFQVLFHSVFFEQYFYDLQVLIYSVVVCYALLILIFLFFFLSKKERLFNYLAVRPHT